MLEVHINFHSVANACSVLVIEVQLPSCVLVRGLLDLVSGSVGNPPKRAFHCGALLEHHLTILGPYVIEVQVYRQTARWEEAEIERRPPLEYE
jgi:hypothetical protein